MRVVLSREIGFCFGVKRALKMVEDNLLKMKKPIKMYGSLVHNEEVVKRLKQEGVKIIVGNLKNVKRGTLIITAHGVSPAIKDELRKRQGLDLLDTTCPIVADVQNKAISLEKENKEVLIFGDPVHQETLGIKGAAKGKGIVFSSKEELLKLKFKKNKRYGLLAQTTQNFEKFEEIKKIIKRKLPKVEILGAICQVSLKKQAEIKKIAERTDAVLIVGSPTSANTRRLYQIALKINPRTFFVKTAGDLRREWLLGAKSVGIGGGASTPDWIIREVKDKLKTYDSKKKTRKIKVGDIFIGGNAPLSVQSMTKTDTRDVKATVEQIKKLERVGCEIIRVAVPDMEAAKVLGDIKKQINIPLVADIHFSAELALEAINQDVDKLRINPGNIGSEEKIKAVVLAAQKKKIPIRIGVNAGSLEKDLLLKYGGKATAEAMVESAMRHIKILEKYDFQDIVVSLKASDIQRTVAAYRLLSQKVDYPLHLGITEAGTVFRGTVMSAIGLGILLEEGIGDTLRVSLSAPPEEEIKTAWEILKSLEIRKRGVTITSCPTCGRTEINLVRLTEKIEKATQSINKDIHLAVMGCTVNGVGEAREADLAIVGGKKVGLIVKRGVIMKKVPEGKLFEEFIKELKKIVR